MKATSATKIKSFFIFFNLGKPINSNDITKYIVISLKNGISSCLKICGYNGEIIKKQDPLLIYRL